MSLLSWSSFRSQVHAPGLVVAANVIIGLIRVTSYLLDRQIRHLEQAFITEGGLRERMTRARLAYRNKPHLAGPGPYMGSQHFPEDDAPLHPAG